MATTDFKETGKIKFSDINDLQNNSITTGNIYASDTSADIGTADNPFDKVYANYYYGRIHPWVKRFEMLSIPLTSLSTGATLLFETNSSPISDYNFLTLASTGTSNAVYIPTDLILSVHSNQFGGYRYTLNDYGVLNFYFLPDGSGIYILSGISAYGSSVHFMIHGYK